MSDLYKESLKIPFKKTDEQKLARSLKSAMQPFADKIEQLKNIKVNAPDVNVTVQPTEVKFPDTMKTEVTNPTKFDMPIGQGNLAGKADPEKYVPVRLTDGKRFYNAIADAFVSASKVVFPFVNPNGSAKPASVDNSGNLNVNIVSGGTGGGAVTSVSGTLNATIDNFPTVQHVYVENQGSSTVTTTSGSPLFTYSVNEPTVRQVFVTNPASANVTTTSGTPLDVTVRNIPTIQTVTVSNPTTQVTTLSGSMVDIKNFPTTQNIQGNVVVTTMPNVTTASGSIVDIKNFPSIQTVVVSNPDRTVTTLSGSIVDVKNFPTVQTVQGNVAITSIPNVTTASGSQVDVKNFPTIQTVQGNVAVTSLPNVTTASGSKTDVSNFPTVQTVVVKNQVDVTTSGNQHAFIDNFPTIQRVYVDNPSSSTVTTTSGTPLDVTVRNIPTVQTVNVLNQPAQTGSKTPGEGYANPTTAIDASSLLMGWDGGNWNRVFVYAPGDAANNDRGVLTNSRLMGWNGASWDRIMSGGTNADNEAPLTTGAMAVENYQMLLNKVGTFDRARGDTTNGMYVQMPKGTTISGSVTTISGSIVDVKNFPTIQSVHLRDAGGALLGISTSPVTTSGVKTGWFSTTISGLATAGGATSVKASGGYFGGYYVYNPNASVAYLQVFDTTAVTLGSTSPIITLGIPATGAANLVFPVDSGRFCNQAIKVAATTTAKGSTAPTSGLDATIYYN